jgi:N-acetylmuramoyl-L-alanine amidase
MKIVIDAGHGGKDSGALGENLKEKDVVLNIAHHLAMILKKYNIESVMTRRNDIFLSLAERCDIANKENADLFISIHCNSYNKTASGIETYCFKKESEAGKLAQDAQDAMMKIFPTHIDRGVKEAGFYVLKNTNMPAILVECEFIDSMSDFLRKDGTQYKFAIAIANGILKYKNIEIKTEPAKKENIESPEVEDSIIIKILKFLSGLFKKN